MKIISEATAEKFVNLAVAKLSQYIKENNLKGVTTGISGGIDSAVVAVIGIQSIKRLVSSGYQASFKYFYLDCQSDHQDLIKANILAKRFNFNLEICDLSRWYEKSPLLALIPKNHPQAKIAQGNIKARLRMIALYQFALLNNYIYLDTDDFSEKLMGFWTRHGDEGDVKLIQEVTKTEVYDLAEYFHIPEEILKSLPGDGIGVTQNNLAIEQLGLDYIYIEYIISRFVEQGFDYNGSDQQLKLSKFLELQKIVAQEIYKPSNLIKKILERTLKTSYKRKFGDYAANLMPVRKKFGFLEFGTKAFNQKYLNAIIY